MTNQVQVRYATRQVNGKFVALRSTTPVGSIFGAAPVKTTILGKFLTKQDALNAIAARKGA
jgi:hypothetical protein